MRIQAVRARSIYDSRGNPTVEAEVLLDDGSLGRASVPSGASKGSREALELRDGDTKRFKGLGVEKAINSITKVIAPEIIDQDFDQSAVDKLLIELDGTENKSKLGANATLAVSLAVARARAQSRHLQVYQDLASNTSSYTVPLPLVNVFNGGKHANNSTDFQEFLLMPVGAGSFREATRMCSEIFHTLGKILNDRHMATTVGDEGGFAPSGTDNEAALNIILEAIEQAGYKTHRDIMIGIDVAASSLWQDEKYFLPAQQKEFTSSEMVDWLIGLVEKYPIASIEDPLAEDDWEYWTKLTAAIGDHVQLIGDDLFVTNTRYLQEGIDKKAANAILLKPNQIGTLTETIEAQNLAKENGYRSILSHRSGETEDSILAHLAVGLGVHQLKSGSMSRSERLAKYNELLRIEEQLGSRARYAGWLDFKNPTK